jgi:rhamnulokinase
VKAVAVDLGASSVRTAAGALADDRIEFDLVDSRPNQTVGRCWDAAFLEDYCRQATALAMTQGASVGIDSWGVDNVLMVGDERVEGPVMYRDPSHQRAADRLSAESDRLFQATGVAHQPFNTVFQLAARAEEDPGLPSRAQFVLLPAYLTMRLTKDVRYETTMSSTTQLMGLDGAWSSEAFNVAGWPAPRICPELPGRIAPGPSGVPVVTVASHDTASAVLGMGTLRAGEAFLNVGTWSLLGRVLDRPILSRDAQEGGWTNERAADGRFRFLKNLPGFFIVNRLHEELAVGGSVAEWLATRDRRFFGRFDAASATLYNPDSMVAACQELCNVAPKTVAQWAHAAIESLVATVASEVPRLARVTDQKVERLRLAGGASRNADFCQALADRAGVPVAAGPAEATVLGNLGMQFLARGGVDASELAAVLDRSAGLVEYLPGGS